MLRSPISYLYEKMLAPLGLALLALAAVVNATAMFMLEPQFKRLDDIRELVVQNRNVVDEIQGIQYMVSSAESAQRGFLHTDNIDYLVPLNDNESRIVASIKKLTGMVVDNPSQKLLAEQLGKALSEKLGDLQKTIAVQQMGQQDAARMIVRTDTGKQLMEAIDKIAARMIAQEEDVRRGRVLTWANIKQQIQWGFAGVLLVNAILLLAGFITITRDMARKRAEVVRLDELATVLASEVAQRAAELRALTAYLLRVQEEERRTVARELHDELGGTLSAVKMDIIMGRDAAAKRSDEKSVARLQRAHTSIDSAIQFTRRLIEDLRPTLLDNLGFEAALRSMSEQFSERCSVPCVISLPAGELNLSSAQSTALYRVCQEALTNVMKYAKANQVTINLTSNGEQWTLILADDGVGLEATKQHRSMSHGLLGMRERMVALDGTFDIRGDAGRGTTLTATFPVVKTETAAL